jgi:hypothetical protein
MCLEYSITGPYSGPKKFCPHIPKILLQNTFQYYAYLMSITSKKSLLFRIAFQISKGTWNTQYYTKQEIVTYTLNMYFLWQMA